jgi:hypothetical protein
VEAQMKAFAFLVVLLLVIPMTILNPMGRDAFLGYYAGVIATWAAYVFAFACAAAKARPEISS